MTRDVGFAMRGLVHIRLPLHMRAANDNVCPASDPPPVRPPPIRPLDDLSVRRAEREFLRS